MALVELPSGIWRGHYEQYGVRHAQQVLMELADGLVRGDGIDGIGPFEIDGEYRADGELVRIGWVKTYEGAHSVLYLGTLERGVMTGHWSVGGMRGAFVLHPPGSLPRS